jgi:hypothetical protein
MYGLFIKNIWFDWLIVTWWQAWWIEYVSWVCGYIPERRASFGTAADCFGVSVGASRAPTWVLMFSLYAFARLTVLGWEPDGLCVYLRELVTCLGYTMSCHWLSMPSTLLGRCGLPPGFRPLSGICPTLPDPVRTVSDTSRTVYIVQTLGALPGRRGLPQAAADHRRVPIGPYLGHYWKNSLQSHVLHLANLQCKT